MACERCETARAEGRRYCPQCGLPVHDPGFPIPGAGDRLADMEIGELLAEGGFAVILAARRLPDGPELAVKLYKPSACDIHEIRPRMLRARELYPRIAAVPGVIRVLGHGVDSEYGEYQVMERVHGKDLRATLVARGGPLPRAEALATGTGLLRVLAALERLGVVHRDVKASNVLLRGDRATTDPKRVVLCDVDFLRAPSDARGQSDVTQLDIRSGKYFDPIAAHQSDQYSAGMVLFDLLTGQVDASVVDAAHLREASLGSLGELGAVALRATEMARARRYATVSHLAAAWERAATGAQGTDIEPRGGPASAQRPRSARRAWLAVAGLAAAVGLVLVGMAWIGDDAAGLVQATPASALPPGPRQDDEHAIEIESLVREAEADRALGKLDRAIEKLERARVLAAVEPVRAEHVERVERALEGTVDAQVELVEREGDQQLALLEFSAAVASYGKVLDRLALVGKQHSEGAERVRRKLQDEVLVHGAAGEIRLHDDWVELTVDNLLLAAERERDDGRRIALYKRALREHPGHQRANLELARVHASRFLRQSDEDDREGAERHFLRAFSSGPDADVALVAAEEAALFLYRYDALESFHAALDYLLEHDAAEPLWSFLAARFSDDLAQLDARLAAALHADADLASLSRDTFPLHLRDRLLVLAMVNERSGLLNLAELQLQEALGSGRAELRVASLDDLELALQLLLRVGGAREALMRTVVYERDGWIYTLQRLANGSSGAEQRVAAGRHPLWSPDKTRIVFVRGTDAWPSLWVVDTDGANEQRLRDNLNGKEQFTLEWYASTMHQESRIGWSDDGRVLRYSHSARAVPDDVNVAQFEVDEHAVVAAFTRISGDAHYFDDSVRLSPHREKRGDGSRYWEYRRNGRAFIESGAEDFLHSWKIAKDGSRIVYRRADSLRVFDFRDSREHGIGLTEAIDRYGRYPSWGPDAEHVLVSLDDRMLLVDPRSGTIKDELRVRGVNPQWTPYSHLGIVIERQKLGMRESVEEMLTRFLAPTGGAGTRAEGVALAAGLGSFAEIDDPERRVAFHDALARGYEALRASDGAAACTHFEGARTLHPSHPEPLAGLALALLEPWSSSRQISKERFAKSNALVRAAIERCPKAEYWLLDCWMHLVAATSRAEVEEEWLSRSVTALVMAGFFRDTLDTPLTALQSGAAEAARLLSRGVARGSASADSLAFDRSAFRAATSSLELDNPLDAIHLAGNPVAAASVAASLVDLVGRVDARLAAVSYTRDGTLREVRERRDTLLGRADPFVRLARRAQPSMDAQAFAQLVEIELARVLSMGDPEAREERLQDLRSDVSRRLGSGSDAAGLYALRGRLSAALLDHEGAAEDLSRAARMGDLQGALPELQRPSDCLLLAAIYHHELGEPERARPILHRLACLLPEDPRPLLELAELAYHQDGDAGAARRIIDRAAVLSPDDPRTLGLASFYHFADADYSGALELAQRGLGVADGDRARQAFLYERVGFASLALGSLQDAEQAFRAACERDSTVIASLTAALIAQGQWAEARTAHGRAPISPGIRGDVAEFHLENADLMGGELLASSLRGQVAVGLGHAYLWKTEDAKRVLLEVLERLTDTDESRDLERRARLVLGDVAMHRERDFVAALEHHLRVLALRPNDPIALYRAARAEVTLSRGEVQPERSWRRKAHALDLLYRLMASGHGDYWADVRQDPAFDELRGYERYGALQHAGA